MINLNLNNVCFPHLNTLTCPVLGRKRPRSPRKRRDLARFWQFINQIRHFLGRPYGKMRYFAAGGKWMPDQGGHDGEKDEGGG